MSPEQVKRDVGQVYNHCQQTLNALYDGPYVLDLGVSQRAGVRQQFGVAHDTSQRAFHIVHDRVGQAALESLQLAELGVGNLQVNGLPGDDLIGTPDDQI